MAGKSSGKNRNRGNVVVRRDEIVEGGHHGGAWKVAYADFVTAMMAFFLLMWLLNATTEAQRKGIADYFTPNNILSRGSSGTGLPFGGKTPFEQGELVSDRGAQAVIQGHAAAQPHPEDSQADQPPGVPANGAGGHAEDAPGNGSARGLPDDASGDSSADASTRGPRAVGGGSAATAAPVPAQVVGQAAALANAGSGVKDPAAQLEQAAFDQAAAQIRAAMAGDPQLAALSAQLSIDMTPQGLRIQMLDADRRSMFATGSSVPNAYAALILEKIAPALLKLPGAITVAGHTDAAPYKGTGKSNWELSTERANATRRALVQAGVPGGRFRSVTGNADRDPLLPADPLAAANRRIAITVLRAAPPAPAPAPAPEH